MASILTRDSSGGSPADAVIFVGVSLVLGVACRHALRGTHVPYTVALLVLGIGLGGLEYGTHHGLGKIGAGSRLWANIDPDLLLAVFLPALLFESSFLLEVHQIKRCMMQMFLLAVPGVLISTFFLGAALKLVFPYNWSWNTSLLLGGLLGATDPVAVVALLKELGASKKLTTIIEGESMMNDGAAIVVYQLFYRMVLGWNFNWGGIIKFLLQATFGAVGLGLAFGIASVLWLGFIFNDTVIEISLTFAVSYMAFFTAQEVFNVSGVLTVMTLGMFYSVVARTAFKGESQQSLHHFWEMVAYIANTLIFILSGVVIAESILRSSSLFKAHGHSWGYLLLLYVFVQAARVVLVGVLLPFLRYFGYGLDWKEAIMIVWSGLRGVVALALSLSIKIRFNKWKKLGYIPTERTSDKSPYISSDTGTLFVFLTGGIVFLTIVVNGSTAQFLLRLLKIDSLSAPKRRMLNYTKYEMLDKALEAFRDLGDDEELGSADWPTVKRYITSLNGVDGERIHLHSSSENDDNPDRMNLKDIRVRFLNGIQSAYWAMLDEGRITQTTANLLMQSVDEAIDLVSHEALCDWKCLKSYVNIPNHYKFLKSSIVPQNLVLYFTSERLESECCISAAFLRAHRTARQQLHKFIGDSKIAAVVIRESELEGKEARQFLEDVRVSFPQVLRVVKTRQVTYSVLNRLIEYIHNLEKIGLLEKKETSRLHDAVQTDLKKLLRNPPLVKIPKIRDLILTNPLLGALPATVRERVVGSTKEIMKMSGTTLYREGSKATGIWLISNGVVKWSRKNTNQKQHSMHPTFTHGSILGLYEILAEKPYICDITTDSVVLCFYIEAEKISSALRSDPAVEDFFWRESLIVLAKLLLPHVFENMSMQDLRTLIAERSMINIYMSGDSFEILQDQSVGLLLDGYVRLQDGQDEPLRSPAAILPRVRSETSASVYQAEIRARVVIFDIAGFENNRDLMSWPQPFQHRDWEVADEREHLLSARAMQLNTSDKHSRVKLTRSLSYPRAHTRHPIASQGSSTLRKKLDMQEIKQGNMVHRESHATRDDSGCEDEHIVSIDSPRTVV